MTQTYRAVVIGCGQRPGSGGRGKLEAGFAVGYTHGKMYHAHPQLELVAAADINQANLDAFREQFEIPDEGGFLDYREMLEEAKPDLVSIATYVGLHGPMLLDAARAGVRGVFCEKPFVDSPKTLAEVRRVVNETGIRISICHQRRMLPAFQRARELYNDGTIGQRLMCSAGIKGWELSEWGSHWLDMLRFLHRDEPLEWVMGQCRVRGSRGFGHAMEEHGVAYFKFANSGFGLVDGGFNPTAPCSMVLTGSEGMIRVEGEETLHIDAPDGRRVETFDVANAWTAMLEAHLAWLEGGQSPPCGLPNTYGSAELNLAAYLSALRSDRIDLPVNDELKGLDEWPIEVMARKE